MKKIIIAGIICILLIAACFSPWRDENLGTFTIVIGSGNGRTIWDEGEGGNKADLIHTISLSDGPEPVEPKIAKDGSQTVVFTSVKPGSYKIFVKAELEDEDEDRILQAVGSDTVNIKPGKNSAVIKMSEPDGEGYWRVIFNFEENKSINRYVPAGTPVSLPKKYRDMKQTLPAGLYEETLEDAVVYFDDYGKWYNGNTVFNFEEPINGNIELKGKWENLPKPNSNYKPITDSNIMSAFELINAESPGEYTILLNGDINIAVAASLSLSTPSSNYKRELTFIGIDEPRTIQNNGTFDIYNNGHLIIGKNITLKTNTPITKALVEINSGGTLTMLDGSKITGNTYNNESESEGGGVYVKGSGYFYMKGGEISDNTISGMDVSGGGGVYVKGEFIMEGGTISGNSAGYGGGVYVDEGGTFTMEGGTISGNSAGYGGGVYTEGTFKITEDSSNVKISRNWADYGGGVYVYSEEEGIIGKFNMDNGVISGNWAGINGGGVYVDKNAIFKKTKGIIYGYEYKGFDNEKNTPPSDIENKAAYGEGISFDENAEHGHTVYDNNQEPLYFNVTLYADTPWPLP